MFTSAPSDARFVLSAFSRALFLLFSCLYLWWCPFSLAQTGSATLSGTVLDESGRAVPETEIAITNVDTNAVSSTKTNTSGTYVLEGLKPGRYRINVSKQGFKQITVTDVVLNTQDSVSRNFDLVVGATSETITVNANAEHMETDNPAVGLLVDRTFVEATPLNGRSFQDLIALAPGAVSSAAGGGLFSVNGQRADSNNFTVDGVAANVNPTTAMLGADQTTGLTGIYPAQTALGTTQALTSVDSLQEFKIQTSGYSAEYGRQPGGQIQLTTRSGSNDTHGSAFDYFRNTVLDANSWVNNFNGIPRQGEHQNDFGGTVGGALQLPHLYDGKDRTFYFFSYEGLRLLTPSSSNDVAVPTAAFRQFASPALQPFLNSLPLPNGAMNGDQCAASQGESFSCTGQWSGGYSNPSSIDALSVRIDQVIGGKWRIFGRYSYTPSSTSNRQFGQKASELDTTTLDTQTATLGATVQLKANLLSEFRFNYTNAIGTSTSTPIAVAGSVPYAKTLLIPSQYAPGSTTAFTDLCLCLPTINFIGFPTYGNEHYRQNQINIVGGLSWTLGLHSLKFGADYRRLAPEYNPYKYSSFLLLTSSASVQQGVADVLNTNSYNSAFPIIHNLSLYVDDRWKMTTRFTLEYGLRWEFSPAPGASNGVYPLALTTSNLNIAQLAPTGTPQYHTIYHDFAPRVGFAYSITKSQTYPLVVRGGIGIFYDTGQSQTAAGYTQYPFFALNHSTNVALPASVADLAPPSSTMQPLVPPYGLLNGISDPHLLAPYTEQWNLSVDQNLSARNTLTLSYVGNVGRKLLFTTEYNQGGGPYPPSNPIFTQVNLTSNAASSSYNALQVQDSGYIVPNLQLIASYTWAHALDNASTDFATGYGEYPTRGNSDNDIRQLLNFAVNYKIPGAKSNQLLRMLTSGWSFNNRFAAQTGYPMDIIQSVYYLPDGTPATVNPDLVKGARIYLHGVPNVPGGWALNSAAFSPVPLNPDGTPTRLGTLGRNFIHGPGFWSLNTAVERVFPLSERIRLNFRIDAFNILNHFNPSAPDNYLPDANFGKSFGPQLTINNGNAFYGTGAARSLQLMLKLQF